MFQKLLSLVLLFFSIVFLSSLHVYAQENESSSEVPADALVSITLKDGSNLKGKIAHEDEMNISIVTTSNLEVKVPKSSIVSMNPIPGRLVEGVFQRFNPNYSRLIFTPTGRPLRKGTGFFSDYYLFLPGVSYGFTNQISIMAGMSIVPVVDFDEQIRYIAPRIGIQISDKLAVSVGTLYISFANSPEFPEGSAGIAFAVGTIGHHDKSFTAGIGFGYTNCQTPLSEEDEDFEFVKHPIIMFGGNIRLSNSLALVSENWYFTGLELSNQPLGVAIRFFGDRLSADVGVIIIGEVLKEWCFPIPWLSFVYNFGK